MTSLLVLILRFNLRSLGGSLALGMSPSATITVEDCDFSDNSASLSANAYWGVLFGGALGIGPIDATILRSNFSHNGLYNRAALYTAVSVCSEHWWAAMDTRRAANSRMGRQQPQRVICILNGGGGAGISSCSLDGNVVGSYCWRAGEGEGGVKARQRHMQATPQTGMRRHTPWGKVIP